MVQKRNVATAIILSLVTCGIYGIIWFIQMTNDANTVANKPNATSGGMAFILTLVTCGIYGFIWAYQLGAKLDDAYAAKGLATGNRAIVYLLLTIFGLGIVTYALAQSSINELA